MGRSPAAGALATTLVLGLLIAPATPATAETGVAPREVTVIPEYEPTVLPVEKVLFAGESGFLHRHNASKNYLWTRYDTGQTVIVHELYGAAPGALRPAGGDTVSVWDVFQGQPADGRMSVLDLGDRSWERWAPPAEGAVFGIYGRTMIARLGDMRLVLHTVDADGNITDSRPVTGIPAGSHYSGDPQVGDATSVVVGVETPDDELWYGLLDIATATVVPIPDAETAAPTDFRLSGDTVAWVTNDGTAHVHSRAGLTSGTSAGARVVTVPSARSRLTVLRDRVLAVVDPAPGKTEGSVVSVAMDGSGRTTVLPRAQLADSLLQGPDGTALAVGGTNSRDWAVHRFTATDGEPGHAPVLPVRDPVENAGLTYRRGVVRHLQTQVSPTTSETLYALFNHTLAADAVSGAVPEAGGTLGIATVTAACGGPVRCVRMVDGADGGANHLVEIQGSTLIATKRIGASSYTVVPTTGARLVDAMDRYAVVDGGSPATQYVVDVVQTEVVRTGPITGAGLWFDTLWTATGTHGQLRQLRLPTLQTMRTVAIGAACVPTEVQTGARWLYWTCGAAGPAGVYDLQNNSNLTVPAGPVLLGDGFLVRHDTATASLQMTDFHDGTPRAPVKLADLAVGTAGDDRGMTWAVDKQGAGVAYVDADNAVHVLDTGVPGSAPAIGKAATNSASNPRGYTEEARHWAGTFQPSRPLSSWRLTITRKTTGEVVLQRSGGPVRDQMGAVWDGKLSSGKMAFNGGYRWTLYGTVDGGPETTLGSGSLQVICGSFPFRTVDCHGSPSVLGVKSTGAGHWYGDTNGGEPSGELLHNGQTDYWCLSCTGAAQTTALVPFGDYSGDGYPDLLVRDGKGGLKAHLGAGYMNYGLGKTISLGSGWLTYRTMFAPGDVNSDGHDDLLGIDTYGKLWLYTTTGRGTMSSRVQVGSGWGIYPRVIGAGDLNGDGHGDLLGIDSSGVMYRYSSNGKKGWIGRVRLGSGWNTYNAVVPIGDLNQDGRNDLLARDANGGLWYYAGLGNGSFAARVNVGRSWNTYKIIV